MIKYGVGIVGTGHYLPDNVQSNEDLCKILLDVNPEWIVSKTGIKRRYIATEDDSASNMSILAARKVLEENNISGEDIGLIAVATFSPDYMFPPVSAKIQKELKCTKAQIVDINTNCTGFITALTIASDRMRVDQSVKYSLVIGVELHTRYINPKDKETAIFFSDGAGVALLGQVDEGSGIINSHFKTDSSTYESVRFRGGGSSFPFSKRSFSPDIDFMEMNGLATWKQAVTNMPILIKDLLTKISMDIDDIDFCLFHQANLNLINYVMAKLKIPGEKTYTNVQEIGNCGSASVGIVLSEAMIFGKIKPGNTVLFAGVGAGFNFGASIWKFT
ncbi:MAG: ketoacyl-ACP synthase III [Bacteroidetes bacterium]|nr:ketoacyl-ACP synthase III [Bacteroidota bacterium]MDA1119608.1 ketoacyl-ACP synthase III [Bacteroidota bacterium]